MRFAVRSLIVFISVFLLLVVFIKPSFAQYYPGNSSPTQNSPSFNNQSLHIYAQSVLIELSSALICQLTGKDYVTTSQGCLGLDLKTGKIGYVQNQGLIPFMTQSIAMLYTPPTHTIYFFKDLAANFGLAKPVLAAPQVGFTTLSPFQNVWKTFRNLAYLVFVVIFLIIGIGIMLRIRIDPRTVMTIQNMLPKIVIGLILITFSFAIAGFLIDLMWVSIMLVINILAGISPTTNIGQDYYQNPFQLVNLFGGILGVANSAGGTIQNLVQQSFNPPALNSIMQMPQQANQPGCAPWDVPCWAGGFISGTIGGLLNNVIGWLVSFIVGIFAFLIIIIAIIWALFKIWFALIKAYIFTLADIVLSPFWILAGLIPGSSIGFGAWLRDMLSNLAVFPVTIGMFLLARILMDDVSGIQSAYMPPLISGVSGSFGSIIALGILLCAPGAIDMAKAVFKAPKINLGPVEKSIGAGQAVVMAGVGALAGRAYYKDEMGNRKGIAYFTGLNAQTKAQQVSNWAATKPVGKQIAQGVSAVKSSPVGRAASKVRAFTKPPPGYQDKYTRSGGTSDGSTPEPPTPGGTTGGDST